MSPTRVPISVTLPLEEWQHVAGVLKAGARHLETPAGAVVDVFMDAYKRAILNGLSAEEIDAAFDAMGKRPD